MSDKKQTYANFVPDAGELRTADAQAVIPEPVAIRLVPDSKKTMPPVKALHGVTNYAPLGSTSMAYPLDVRSRLKELHVPYAYFHDDPYVSKGKDVIDVSRIFPLFHADETNPANYLFAETDDYLRPLVEDGVKIIYRLGESIECGGTCYRTCPPKDYAKWTRICLNIVRHYTEGWANGHHWDMTDWAVWEEPNNPNLWHGSFEAYLELYKSISVAFKQVFTRLRIGGPSTTTLGYRFLDQFLAFVKKENLPLDFVNYTGYYLTPAEYLQESVKRRELVDRHGFVDVPLWCTEWHCSPFWHAFADPAAYGRERNRYGGTEGAAFAATALCGLQDAPLERACFYSACIGGGYGLIDAECRPTPAYYVFQKFARLCNASVRRIAIEIRNASANTEALLSEKSDGMLELLCGTFSRIEGSITIEVPQGYEVHDVQVLDEMSSPRFAEMEQERIVRDGGTLTLGKYACASVFHVTFRPCGGK